MIIGSKVRLISIAEFYAQCKQANPGEHMIPPLMVGDIGTVIQPPLFTNDVFQVQFACCTLYCSENMVEEIEEKGISQMAWDKSALGLMSGGGLDEVGRQENVKRRMHESFDGGKKVLTPEADAEYRERLLQHLNPGMWLERKSAEQEREAAKRDLEQFKIETSVPFEYPRDMFKDFLKNIPKHNSKDDWFEISFDEMVPKITLWSNSFDNGKLLKIVDSFKISKERLQDLINNPAEGRHTINQDTFQNVYIKFSTELNKLLVWNVGLVAHPDQHKKVQLILNSPAGMIIDAFLLIPEDGNLPIGFWDGEDQYSLIEFDEVLAWRHIK